MSIKIQNRLEVLQGNRLMVPGCEPTSAFTSPTLAENRDCEVTVVDLADAIKAIPDATIVSWGNPRTRFFVLPSGPPPVPQDCTDCKVKPDWYAILRSIGSVIEVDKLTKRCPANIQISDGQVCEAFPLKNVF